MVDLLSGIAAGLRREHESPRPARHDRLYLSRRL
jgi:hypothetical protein